MHRENLIHDVAPLALPLLGYGLDHLRLLIRHRNLQRLDFTLESMWLAVLFNLVFGLAATALLWKSLARREVRLAPCLAYLAVGITALLFPGPGRLAIGMISPPPVAWFLTIKVFNRIPGAFDWYGFMPLAGAMLLALGIVKLLQRRTTT